MILQIGCVIGVLVSAAAAFHFYALFSIHLFTKYGKRKSLSRRDTVWLYLISAAETILPLCLALVFAWLSGTRAVHLVGFYIGVVWLLGWLFIFVWLEDRKIFLRDLRKILGIKPKEDFHSGNSGLQKLQ